MFLNLNRDMKLVFDLREKNRKEPYLMEMYQKATLSENNTIGLKGTYGLYGTDIWWENIKNGKLKTKEISGVITEVYIDGQENDYNAFLLKLNNNDIWQEAIMYLNEEDYSLFNVGHLVKIFYVFDERKYQPNNDVVYSDIVIEMAVSYKPIEENTISKTKKFFSFWKK